MSAGRTIQAMLPNQAGYTIRIGKDVLGTVGATAHELKPCRNAVVISDETVGPIHGKLVKKRLQEAGYETYDLLIPPGEESKSIELAAEIWDSLVHYGFCRDDLIVACGGGVVGDLAGFVASTYMRGVDFIQVPTTLLAMVDASIGGKTAVNLSAGKNLVGTFHQPIHICSDIRVLRTLKDEDWANGLAEIVKSAIVAPRRSFYEWVRDNAVGLLEHDDDTLEEAVYRTAEFKVSVVSKDATEQAGIRECLNYGHTLGHAVETAAGYGAIGHGRAVAEGMRFAARLAVEVLGTDVAFIKKQDALLDALGLRALAWTSEPATLLGLMRTDKKNRDGVIRFVLPRDFTKWELVSVPDEVIKAHLEAWCSAKRKLIGSQGGVA